MSTEPEKSFPFICGLDAALRVIGGKWKPLVLYFLRKGPMRYGELRRSVRGVSDKVLIQQLKELEAHGIILRTDYGEVPPRVDYTLTPLGCSLADTLTSLCVWGEKNAATIAAALAEREKESVG
ncbi:helix-turn-helix domain-containing protein [uncultured Roseibium sp.]|uniref:winged helix-turn-helix transcriptional regulator n=1 Tax=uncultured Roseibium sp. TaxID=1936171 RepID=UPI002612AA2D|nr:helix-turn-helix domain-containing protein [uncultured Roseibium sp.]